jgi:hypothetical protein
MSIETKEAIRAKIAQSRWFLCQTTAESLRTYIEELEHRLLIEMGEGPSE